MNINNLPSTAQSVTNHLYLIVGYNSTEGCTLSRDYISASMEVAPKVTNTCKTWLDMPTVTYQRSLNVHSATIVVIKNAY